MLIWVLIGVIGLVIILPSVISAQSKFACPICGHHFKSKWYKVLSASFGSSLELQAKQYNLKCPRCGMRDECSKPDKK